MAAVAVVTIGGSWRPADDGGEELSRDGNINRVSKTGSGQALRLCRVVVVGDGRAPAAARQGAEVPRRSPSRPRRPKAMVRCRCARAARAHDGVATSAPARPRAPRRRNRLRPAPDARGVQSLGVADVLTNRSALQP